MASLEKFKIGQCFAVLHHNDRGVDNPSNIDIDSNRSELNERLEPNRGISCYYYLKKRLSELYVYNRKDVNVMAGWIVTAPQELPQSQEKQFFAETYKFLCDRYGGEQNCIQAVIHRDEGGQPHMHFCFVPVVPDVKHAQGFKVCANDVLNKRELRNFHPALQKHLNDAGIKARVQTGITAKNGRNYTVNELKQQSREQEYKHNLTNFTWR